MDMDATIIANSMLTDGSKATLVSANFLGVDPQVGAFNTPKQKYPIDGDSYAILSCGVASNVLNGPARTFINTALGGRSIPGGHPYVPGMDVNDVGTLTIDLQVPADANTVSFRWQWGTEEIPEYIGSNFMDYFIAKIKLPDGSEHDITNMPNGLGPTVDNVIDYVNLPGGSSNIPLPPFPIPDDVALNAMTTPGQKDTNFVPFTSVYDVSPYRGQQISLIFEVGDASDSNYDTAVLLDELGFDVVTNMLQLVPGTLEVCPAEVKVDIFNPNGNSAVTTDFNAYTQIVYRNGSSKYTIHQTKAVTRNPLATARETFTVNLPDLTSPDIESYCVGVKRFDVPPQSPQGITNLYVCFGGGALIKVNKTADRKSAKPEEIITYTIDICNVGNSPATNVVVEDVFNRDVEIVSVSPPPDGDGRWHLGTLNPGGSVTITLVIKTLKQDFDFAMDLGVKGEGFVNVANDYNTVPPNYVLTNCVYVTYVANKTAKKVSDCESVTVGEAGTELSTREHGSGTYESDEQVQLLTENKSITMNKDMAATYAPTTLSLYRNRTATYSSKWTEEAKAKNRVTGTTMTESYRYATSIDRESSMFLDENESVIEVNSEFEGMGHIGFLKMPTNSTPGATPIFEAREDYTGSFKILEKVDEYGSAVTSEKSTSGVGLAAVDKRVGKSQRSYESGSGTYDSEELIETYTNYIAKDISLVYSPVIQSLTDDVSIDASQKWKEGMYSKVENTSYIGEEYTGLTELDKETVAMGLNEMDTEAEFSGRARYRAVLKDEVDIDEQYEGDYSIERKILFTGIPKYDRPHLTVVKSGSFAKETIFNAKDETLVGESRDKEITVATYTITVTNDGNRALGPVYVRDLFPPKAVYINASARPSELAETYANWTLTHLAIGDVVTIILNLDVTKHVPSELVNRVEVCGGYNDEEWICASNFTALEKEWLTCCPNETVSVTKTAEVDETNSSVVWYRVDVHNTDDVTRVATVTDLLPEGMVLIDSMVPFASYEKNTVTWNLVKIGPYETVTIAYRVKVPWPGRFVNSVEVDARSVDGPVVQPVLASSVVDVGEADECGTSSCASWSPPNWDFEYVGYPAELTCEDNCGLAL